MRYTILLVLAFVLAGPVQAQPDPNVQMCGQAQRLIAEVMDRRIEGYTQEQILKVALSEDQSEAFNRWLVNMTDTVYSLDRRLLTGDERADLLGKFFATCVRTARGEIF